jgi:branched-subunit amino acid aminotransferase/4-amino-4-deoxychorismate lyase
MLCYIDGRWRPDHVRRIGEYSVIGNFRVNYQANFTTALIHEGAWVFEREHLARLSRDARALGFRAPSAKRIRSTVHEGIKRNRLIAGVVRIIVTAEHGGLSVFFEPLRATPRNVSLVLLESGPTKWSAHKVLGRPQLNELHDAAVQAGYFDALLLDGIDVLEATIANIFVLRRGTVYTPAADGRILPGVARKKLLAERGLNIQEHNLWTADISSCEGIFITNSLRGPVPVSRIESQDGSLAWHSQAPWTWLRPFRKSWRGIIAAELARQK